MLRILGVKPSQVLHIFDGNYPRGSPSSDKKVGQQKKNTDKQIIRVL